MQKLTLLASGSARELDCLHIGKENKEQLTGTEH
jgi:hypothetical protein